MGNKTPKNQFMQDVSVLVDNAPPFHTTLYEDALHHLKFNLAVGSPSNKHSTTTIFNTITHEHIDIDTYIAPLIGYIWLNGISTDLSCENNVPDNYIWINFSTANDLELFLGIVFKDREPEDDFYHRGFPGFGKPDGWYYNIVPSRNKQNDVFISVSVRFPQKDYNIVLEKLKLHYESNKDNNDYSSSSSEQ